MEKPLNWLNPLSPQINFSSCFNRLLKESISLPIETVDSVLDILN